MTQNLKTFIISLISLLSLSNFASAETTMSAEGQYIFNSLGFYLGGVLVAFMAAGFCMLESGLVTTKSVSTIAAKNIGKFAICSLIFFLCGYNLAYGIPEGGFIGSFQCGVILLNLLLVIQIIQTGFFKQCLCVQLLL